jgi:hypothetical protein
MPRRVKSLFHDGDAPDSTELHRRLAVRSERTGTGHDLADYGQALHDAVTPHCSTPEEALAELAAGAADAEGRWVDRSFAGRDAIGDLKCRDRVQWLPIRKVFGIRAAFEVDGLTTSDIRQGSLGDCVRVRNQNKKEKKQKKEQTPLACPLTSLFSASNPNDSNTDTVVPRRARCRGRQKEPGRDDHPAQAVAQARVKGGL